MSHRSDVSFPERNLDPEPLGSSRGRPDQRGADKRALKRALHVLLKAHGADWVQRVVDESVREHPDAKFTAWVDERDKSR